MEQNWELGVLISWDQCMLQEAIYKSIHPIWKYPLSIPVPGPPLPVASRTREGECYLMLTLKSVFWNWQTAFQKIQFVFAVNQDCDKRNWRELHNHELYNLRSSLDIKRIIKLLRMGYVRRIAGTRVVRNAHKMSSGGLAGQGPV